MVMEAQTINNKCMGRIKIQTLEIAGLRSVLEALRRIWQQRHNHRLPAWHDLCHWIESLLFAKELILNGLAENEQQ